MPLTHNYMKKVTVQFDNLQHLAECMFAQDITKPLLDYAQITLTSILTLEQIEEIKKCGARIINEEHISVD